ncbi:MAG: FAD:protein FMN transferase [Candidatus Eiseniibacteriota bacterium]
MAHARAGPDAPAPSLTRTQDHYVGRFRAMASPCEVLIDTDDPSAAEAALRTAETEAHRIERKFSRYLSDNVVHRINHSSGRPVKVDDETAGLIDYAAACHSMSGGLFDITSGALRRVWTFDGGTRVPTDDALRRGLQDVGWDRVTWEHHTLTMPARMEIDLGGIGKEYAVDRAHALVAAEIDHPFIVNFGGDLRASAPRRDGRPWVVGIDDPRQPGEAALYRIEFAAGALATSGDARRFVLHRGKRLGHILNPRTGWPVENAARSVTVLTLTCLEAGTLSTLAYLQGEGAEAFLREQGVQFWVL